MVKRKAMEWENEPIPEVVINDSENHLYLTRKLIEEISKGNAFLDFEIYKDAVSIYLRIFNVLSNSLIINDSRYSHYREFCVMKLSDALLLDGQKIDHFIFMNQVGKCIIDVFNDPEIYGRCKSNHDMILALSDPHELEEIKAIFESSIKSYDES